MVHTTHKKPTSGKDPGSQPNAPSGVVPMDAVTSESNAAVIDCLRRMLKAGFDSRAFLFSGPRGIGKKSLALAVAHALICRNSVKGAVCGTCSDCISLAGRRHPDIMVIDGPDERVGIDVIRELTRSFSQRPVLSTRHIAIVDRSERMTEEAANAFLKSLEEPSGDTVYILTTDAIDLLPKTVVSRCIVFHLMSTPIDELTESLMRHGMVKREARKLAVFTNGRSADALYLATHPEAFDGAKKDASAIIDMMSAPVHDRITYSETVSERRDGVREMLEVTERWESLLDRMLKACIGLTDHGPDAERITMVTRSIGSSNMIVRALDSLLELKTKIRSSGNIRLNLESFVLHLPYLPT